MVSANRGSIPGIRMATRKQPRVILVLPVLPATPVLLLFPVLLVLLVVAIFSLPM
jgi:hypothetical protein